jgi:uncharacterized protein YecT (DUF1311 family)
MAFNVQGVVALGLTAIALAAGCPPSMGQHMNAPDAPCRSGSSNAQISQCFSAAYRDADKKLNDVYRRVLATLGPEDQKALQAAQLLWIHFRDANCEVEHGLYKGGSAAPMVLDACLEALTRQRADDLTTMLGYRLQK